MPDHYVTGGAIRRLREKQGLTQAQLAEALSVSDKTVSKWETARGLPDITLLEPLAQTVIQRSVFHLINDHCSHLHGCCFHLSPWAAKRQQKFGQAGRFMVE